MPLTKKEDSAGCYFQAIVNDYNGSKCYYDPSSIQSTSLAKCKAMYELEHELNRIYLLKHPMKISDMIKWYVPPKWNPEEKWNNNCNQFFK